MENASKALMMAGTILISMIVIAAAIFMYQELVVGERAKNKNAISEEIIQFNKSYESYAKDIYGIQLISLAQKIDDYNNTFGLTQDGYDKIELIVDGTDETQKYSTFKENIDKKIKINLGINPDKFETLYKALETWESNKDSENKEYYAAEYSIRNIVKKDDVEYENLYNKANNIYTDTDGYSAYKELKTKKFKFIKIDYSENGRVKKMEYNEK